MRNFPTWLKLADWVSLMNKSMKKEEQSMFKDPVCGMDVDPQSAAGKSEYQGQTYYFCSPGCKQAFDKEPEKYLKSAQSGQHHQHQ
jgi:YHS domain-containing protein